VRRRLSLEKPMVTMLLSNPAAFFGAVCVDLFGGVIEQTQVDGINSILEAWPEGTDPCFVAYGRREGPTAPIPFSGISRLARQRT
jgi:hypothetical protein